MCEETGGYLTSWDGEDTARHKTLVSHVDDISIHVQKKVHTHIYILKGTHIYIYILRIKGAHAEYGTRRSEVFNVWGGGVHMPTKSTRASARVQIRVYSQRVVHLIIKRYICKKRYIWCRPHCKFFVVACVGVCILDDRLSVDCAWRSCAPHSAVDRVLYGIVACPSSIYVLRSIYTRFAIDNAWRSCASLSDVNNILYVAYLSIHDYRRFSIHTARRSCARSWDLVLPLFFRGRGVG